MRFIVQTKEQLYRALQEAQTHKEGFQKIHGESPSKKYILFFTDENMRSIFVHFIAIFTFSEVKFRRSKVRPNASVNAIQEIANEVDFSHRQDEGRTDATYNDEDFGPDFNYQQEETETDATSDMQIEPMDLSKNSVKIDKESEPMDLSGWRSVDSNDLDTPLDLSIKKSKFF